jgi:hypothetical protein
VEGGRCGHFLPMRMYVTTGLVILRASWRCYFNEKRQHIDAASASGPLEYGKDRHTWMLMLRSGTRILVLRQKAGNWGPAEGRSRSQLLISRGGDYVAVESIGTPERSRHPLMRKIRSSGSVPDITMGRPGVTVEILSTRRNKIY